MDGLTLLSEARRAGLQVRADGDKLVIGGPKRLEPLALRLIAAKPTIMAALRHVDAHGEGAPAPMPTDELPDPPMPRPGFVVELAYNRVRGWYWRQRREDAADRALAAYRAQAQTEPTDTKALPPVWRRLATARARVIARDTFLPARDCATLARADVSALRRRTAESDPGTTDTASNGSASV